MLVNDLRKWFTDKKDIDYALTVQDSLIIKGIAICLMLWHHVFLDNYDYGISVYKFSVFAKVCVSLFLFVSAYGLSIQHDKELSLLKNDLWHSLRFKYIIQFYIKRLLKLYSHFWVIFILFVPIGVFIFDRALSIPYGDENIVFHLLCDFFGLAEFQSYNISWWFYRLIITMYLLFPFLYVAIRRWNIYVIMLSLLLLIYYRSNFQIIPCYLFPFVLGISFAQNRNRISSILNMFHHLRILSLVVFLFWIGVYCRFNCNVLNGIYVDGFISVLIAYIVVLTFRYFRYINDSFVFLGKHSMNVFMIHSFIYYYFFHEQLYSSQNPLVIFSVLLLCCMLLSMLIEYGKEKMGFYTLIGKIDSIKL